MNKYNDIIKDIYETINENREVTIYNNDIYVHFYKENSKILACNKSGYKTKEFDSIEDLFSYIKYNNETYNYFKIEMY